MKEKSYRLIATEVIDRNAYPLIKGIVIETTTSSLYEITELSRAPFCFEIIKQGTLRAGSWYPENVPSNLTLGALFTWVASKF